MNRIRVALIAAAAMFFAASGVAFASHGKAGLWSVQIQISGMSGMPDISRMPPEIQARMKAMGMSANGNVMTVQHCMTPAEVAQDIPRMDPRAGKMCKFANVQTDSHTMSADMICSGEMQGTGHIAFTFDSDTHYTGVVSMTGTAGGHPVDHEQKIEGHWISADCGGVTH